MEFSCPQKSSREENEVWFDGSWFLHHGYLLWFSLTYTFTHPAVPVLESGVGYSAISLVGQLAQKLWFAVTWSVLIGSLPRDSGLLLQ